MRLLRTRPYNWVSELIEHRNGLFVVGFFETALNDTPLTIRHFSRARCSRALGCTMRGHTVLFAAARRYKSPITEQTWPRILSKSELVGEAESTG